MGAVISFFSDETVKVHDNSKHKDVFHKPKFYKNLDGPVFTALDYNRIYATRHYSQIVWVSTIENGASFEESWKSTKPRLEKYFKGKNQRNYRLPRTCPVTMRKTISVNGKEEDFTVSMPISKYFTEDPPGPQHKDIFIRRDYKRIQYAGYFHKQYREENINHDIDILRNSLKSNNETFDDDHCYVVFYDTKHRNLSNIDYYEIWFEGSRQEQDYICLQNYDEDENEVEEVKKVLR